MSEVADLQVDILNKIAILDRCNFVGRPIIAFHACFIVAFFLIFMVLIAIF